MSSLSITTVFKLNFALPLYIFSMFAMFGFCVLFLHMDERLWFDYYFIIISIELFKAFEEDKRRMKKKIGTKSSFSVKQSWKLIKISHFTGPFPMRIVEWIAEDKLNLIISCNGKYKQLVCALVISKHTFNHIKLYNCTQNIHQYFHSHLFFSLSSFLLFPTNSFCLLLFVSFSFCVI